jgi:hypothetical protein
MIAYQSASIIVAAPIELDRQLHSRAIEIEYVRVDLMLTTKLVTRKVPIPQVAPENAFPFGGVLAQMTSVTHGTI